MARETTGSCDTSRGTPSACRSSPSWRASVGREVEAEPVDAASPSSQYLQRVHDELQARRVAHVQRVARACRVDVAREVVRFEPVVGAVVEAAEAERGAVLVALRGVVEDDVEDDLEAAGVECVDHRLELRHLAAGPPGGDGRGVGVVGGEEADGVVAPVVGEPAFDEERLRDVLMHRQQFEGRHAEIDEMTDDGVVPETGVRAPQLGGHPGMHHREALDVAPRRRPSRPGGDAGLGAVPDQSNGRVDHEAPGHEAGASRAGSVCRSSVTSWPRTSGPNRTSPVVAWAYGSSRSLAGLHP